MAQTKEEDMWKDMDDTIESILPLDANEFDSMTQEEFDAIMMSLKRMNTIVDQLTTSFQKTAITIKQTSESLDSIEQACEKLTELEHTTRTLLETNHTS